MATLVYDIAIIGAGASGLQLLYELVQADPSGKKKILLLDSGDRSQKSWCFWEDHTSSSFPFLVEKSWQNMSYRTSQGKTIQSEIGPLSYNYISSEGFFNFFFEQFSFQQTIYKLFRKKWRKGSTLRAEATEYAQSRKFRMETNERTAVTNGRANGGLMCHNLKRAIQYFA
ncbi:MAG: hypothetical protein RIR57_1272 [Bacteroidota bacterium]